MWNKHIVQVANRSGNLARKPSVDAEGLFDLDEAVEALPSEEELSDTDGGEFLTLNNFVFTKVQEGLISCSFPKIN